MTARKNMNLLNARVLTWAYDTQIYAGYKNATAQKLSKKLLMKVFWPEAALRRCSVEKVFLEISQNSQENTCARVSLFK